MGREIFRRNPPVPFSVPRSLWRTRREKKESGEVTGYGDCLHPDHRQRSDKMKEGGEKKRGEVGPKRHALARQQTKTALQKSW